MKGRFHIGVSLAAFAAALLALAGGAAAEVRIVEEEVVFSLGAPGAKEVFLVGDFNNWNPTYEKMSETDGRFEVRLFLLPGRYRYKFVVDGAWMADPDRPPEEPSRGSLLVLAEKDGALAMGSGEAGGEGEGEAGAGELLEPSVRYSGAFLADGGGTETNQTLDVWLSHSSDRLDASADFKTMGDTWDISPLRAEVLFDRGYADLKFGEALFKGFENDTIWSSSDPFRLVGGVGIWGYSAGLDRRGVSAAIPLLPKMKLRGFYADTIGRRPGPPLSFEAGSFGDFASSAAPDTLVYRYAGTYEDEDVWGVEFAGETGSFAFGYARRANKGYQPGVLAEVERVEAGFAASVSTTREFWGADAGWIEWNFWSGLSAIAGFGRGKGEIRTSARSTALVGDPDEIGPGQDTGTYEREFPGQTDKRWTGGFGLRTERASVRAVFTRSEYDFEAGVYAPSSARIGDFALDASYRSSRWAATGAFRYLDQDYGASPGDFHYDTPQRNAWLDHRDRLTVARMVSFDLEKSAGIEAVFSWGRRSLSDVSGSAEGNTREAGKGGAAGKTAAVAGVGVVSRGFFDAVEHASMRFEIERTFRERFFAQWDSRLAHYDKPSWGFEDTFFSTYIEAGYRNRWSETSLGFGFDPVVLDLAANRYADVGREEFLRLGLPERPSRSAAALVGEGLRRQEASLEDYGAVKLEIIIVF